MKRISGRFASACRVAALLGLCLCSIARAQDASTDIKPGEPWFDDRGVQIQAHGGGILHLGKTWFWFGEDRSQTNDPDKRYVACYSSDDLVHWKYHRQVIAMAAPEGLSGHWVLERPKVFFNTKTKKFVMYMHLDDPAYKMARVAVATSDTVDGNYQYIRSFRPLGFESRDIGQFIDDDGAAYLIFESRPSKGFYIAKLSDDYLNVAKEMSFVDAPLEGGAIVHYQGLYYALGSHLTGWKANPNVFATSTTLSGPWSAMRDIAPPEVNTYDSQSSMLIKVVGSKATTVIYVGDRWKPKDLWDSRYIWMPVAISSGTLYLPQPKDWTINVKTGVATVAP